MMLQLILSVSRFSGTCVEFGDKVLSSPELVEAIEGHFIPVFVKNNAMIGKNKVLCLLSPTSAH